MNPRESVALTPHPTSVAPSQTVPPSLQVPKNENDDQDVKGRGFGPALQKLEENMTVYEQEQLEKKKIQMKILFQEKCMVIMEMFGKCISDNPELIGFLPFCSGEEQISNAFDHWLHQHHDQIKNKVQEISMFMAQICTLKSDAQDWNNFVHWMEITQNISQR